MVCSKCGGKIQIADTRRDSSNSVIYRQYICSECKDIHYTAEIEVPATSSFIDTWVDLTRKERKQGEDT